MCLKEEELGKRRRGERKGRGKRKRERERNLSEPFEFLYSQQGVQYLILAFLEPKKKEKKKEK